MNKYEKMTDRVDEVISSTRQLVADAYKLTVGDASAEASDLLQDIDELRECAWTAKMRLVEYLKVRSHRG